jgi:thiol-disulfide isomerase/thioredoxin
VNDHRPRGPARALVAAALLATVLAGCSGSSSATHQALHTSLTPLGGGRPVTLASYAGRPLLVNLWASWCVPCRTEMPRLEAASRRLGSSASVVGVSTDRDHAALQAAARRAGVSYPLLIDPQAKAQDALAPSGLPASYLFDAHGRLVASHQGALSPSTLAAWLHRVGLPG